MLKPIVAGNWKMNKTPLEGKSFIDDVVNRLPTNNNVNVDYISCTWICIANLEC